jgi:hypothetical protein
VRNGRRRDFVKDTITSMKNGFHTLIRNRRCSSWTVGYDVSQDSEQRQSPTY